MTKKHGYSCYLLTDFGKHVLLENLPATFRKVFAHHVTYEFGIPEKLPPIASTVNVIATASNDRIQVAIVEVRGSTVRPDGGTFHITISLDPTLGTKPVDSNKLIADKSKWRPVEHFTVQTLTSFMPFN
jgi:hypothetical protein